MRATWQQDGGGERGEREPIGSGGGCPLSGGLTRRRLLQGLAAGAGTAALAAPVHASPARAGATGDAVGRPLSPATFSRMFPDLPPWGTPGEALAEALVDIGRPGGIMDARDDLAAGPVALIVEPSHSRRNPDNSGHSAGVSFLGQFLDHDVTFDSTSALGVPTDPHRSPNARTAAFDLDSVYGAGPVGSPQLYERADRAKLRIEDGGAFEDLPRDRADVAVIADPRNDENLMLAGLHAACILFHNRVVDAVRGSRGRPSTRRVFERARRIVTLHYQWIVLHEFLPTLVGQGVVDDVLRRRRSLQPRVASIPVEFQIGYRIGHSMIRPSYRANLAGDGGEAFFGMIFDPAGEGSADPVDLRGGFRAPRRFVGWQTFFDFGDGEVRPNKRIDTTLSTPLFHLPLQAITSGDPPTSLATRNLLRELTWSVPSGQAVARQMGAPVLDAGDLDNLSTYGLGLERATPLWFYLLREAEVVEDGARLGPVGGRLVAEVFIRLLALDHRSILNQPLRYRPTVPRRDGTSGDFTMVDLLTYAGVDPASRRQ
jgi:hypothetical protein